MHDSRRRRKAAKEVKTLWLQQRRSGGEETWDRDNEKVSSSAIETRLEYSPHLHPTGRKVTRFGLVTTSLTGIRILGRAFSMNITTTIQMSKLWDDACRWLKILVEVYLDGTYRDDNPVAVYNR